MDFMTFEQFNESVNEAKKNLNVKVMGTIGQFKVFNNKELGDHIILIVGAGHSQYEYPIALKKSNVEKLKQRYYVGREMSIPNPELKESLNEGFFINQDKLEIMFSLDSDSRKRIIDALNKFKKVTVPKEWVSIETQLGNVYIERDKENDFLTIQQVYSTGMNDDKKIILPIKDLSDLIKSIKSVDADKSFHYKIKKQKTFEQFNEYFLNENNHPSDDVEEFKEDLNERLAFNVIKHKGVNIEVPLDNYPSHLQRTGKTDKGEEFNMSSSNKPEDVVDAAEKEMKRLKLKGKLKSVVIHDRYKTGKWD